MSEDKILLEINCSDKVWSGPCQVRNNDDVLSLFFNLGKKCELPKKIIPENLSHEN